MQPNALHAATRNHKRVAVSNTPGIITAPIQNPATKNSEGGQLTSECDQSNSECVHPSKMKSAEA